MWAIEMDWINQTGKNSGCTLIRLDEISQSQILGVQDRHEKGAIPKQAPAALNKTGCSATHWPTQVKAVGSGYWRMIGTTEQLMEKADAIGQRWIKGIGITGQFQKA